MLSPGHTALLRRLALLAALIAFAGQARAQEQERKLLDRIMHPNMELHAEGFEKSFETKASGTSQRAAVRPFGFAGRTANSKGGDGTFHAKAFDDGRGSFRTENYAVKRAAAADLQASQANRSFATNAVPVREDRLANRSVVSDRTYVSATKPYLVPGKRQDSIDDLRRQKNLSIDQVREILNKSE